MSLYLGNNLISGVATPIEGARNIGQIITSTIPLTDAGLHLLDGALISGSGSYTDFVTYIAGLVNTYPDLFETEANWQTSVTNYGVCGKFVYDSVNNTVRLPKITGFIEGTTDLTALGDLIQAGLPNITGKIDARSSSGGATGAFIRGTSVLGNYAGTGNNTESLYAIDLDASRSSSIYGNSNTVQPQAIKVLYYIVISTSTKTQIEVDIDEIATDLNGKADIDLSNINPTQTAKDTIVGWGMPDYSAVTQETYPYTAVCDGIANVYGTAAGSDTVTVNGNNVGIVFSGTNGVTVFLNKGDILNVTGTELAYIYFIPLKGVSNA